MIQATPLRWLRLAAFGLGGAVVLAGCETQYADKGHAYRAEPGVYQATRNGPDGAPQGSCWGRTVSPAVIETVTEQVQVSPAQYNPDGSLLRPPTYRSEARQMIVTPRVDSWFETPCAEALTPDFIASLQRALAVRRYYEGPITGVLDKSTQAAIRAFQRTTGPDSGVLSLASARQLGLIAVDRTTLE